MDAVALKEKAKAEAKAELTAHDPTHAPKDEVALKRTSQSDIPASIYPCDEIELKRKHERDAEQDHTAGVAKKRPRGLKKRGQGSTDKGVQVEQGYERMELPAEVSVAAEGDERIQLESDSAHDAYALYASAMVEVEKDNTPTAKKFFEGAIHGLQALLEVKEKTNDLADNLHLYTLGMAWCELGVLIDDTDYIGRGLQYLGDVIGSGTAAAHVYMDAGQMTLSRYDKGKRVRVQ
ncbi:hypothetical protein SARC_05624 [Sphaeroforma arctica JP610]|uniref:Uncharacterized protein n=1 Tax=Sphaeroforma arctica JP610 TaxID=667725 RepID=A0A0L0G1N0_9EUKA|nr:hypothetical protein SARC_05624 [Sphaeroforma arctica JP610]KNC82073.1 hypothetical protein SARC_05624 [Sphaeroforma arctica JP610]|eukprot:XP_014155975.1 hypothetical protein SARC_05624 [Sphaeroforma arctica JP610]